MRQIDIDDEVFEHIKRESVWEDRNPNDTLRRLFWIENNPEAPCNKDFTEKRPPKKQSKVDLPTLINKGALREGQELRFCFKEPLSKEYRAKVTTNHLEWNSKLFSMSKLVAVILNLEDRDIPSSAYRGPAYWYTDEGKSVKDLWADHLLIH